MVDLNEIREIFPDVVTIEIDAGDNVVCDLCDEDYTHSTRTGGLVFQSKGVCPECAPKFERMVKEFQEEKFIKGRCPPDKSFADWIRESFR